MELVFRSTTPANCSQRAYARFKAWHHEQQVAYAEELKSQGKEPPAPQDPLEEEEESTRTTSKTARTTGAGIRRTDAMP